jgi:hypothetical protein
MFILVGAGFALGADDTAGSVSTRTIDQNLHRVLRDIINQGADLFNQGEHRGCYYLFQGALVTARSQLGHHPDVQKIIDDGLSRTDRSASMGSRAWALRGVLDQVRDRINPNPSKPAEKKPGEGKPGESQPAKPSRGQGSQKQPEIKQAPKPRELPPGTNLEAKPPSPR